MGQRLAACSVLWMEGTLASEPFSYPLIIVNVPPADVDSFSALPLQEADEPLCGQFGDLDTVLNQTRSNFVHHGRACSFTVADVAQSVARCSVVGVDFEYTSALCVSPGAMAQGYLGTLVWIAENSDIYQVGLAPLSHDPESDVYSAASWTIEASSPDAGELTVTSYQVLTGFFDSEHSYSINHYLERRLNLTQLGPLFGHGGGSAIIVSQPKIFVFHNGLVDSILLIKSQNRQRLLDVLRGLEDEQEFASSGPEEQQRILNHKLVQLLREVCGIERFYDTRLLYETSLRLDGPGDSSLAALTASILGIDAKSKAHISGYDALHTVGLFAWAQRDVSDLGSFLAGLENRLYIKETLLKPTKH